MAKEGGYTIENVYQGGYSSLDPNKSYSSSFTGYRANGSSLGLTTDPRTANILKEVSAKLSSGIKNIEVEMVSPEIFDSVPKQHLKEVNELAKLTGIGVSVHGPIMDSAGMSQQGFSELNREAAERKISGFLERIREINPDGIVPVTFHSAGEGIPGSEWKTLGGPGKEREAKKLIAVEKESGKMIPLEREDKYYPGGKRGEIITKEYSPEQNLEIVNSTQWDEKISALFFNKERADEILEKNHLQIRHLLDSINQGRINPDEGLTPTQERAWLKYKDAENYLSEINRNANALFSKAYKFGNEEQKEELKKVSESYRRQLEENKTDFMEQSKAVHRLLVELQNPALAPRMFVPVEEFAVEQSSKTFGNAAFNTYNKFKNLDKTPIIVIENPPAGGALSTGEDVKNLVVASRNHFIERAIKEKGMNKQEAEKIAEKLIGATWDVGHINMLRKQGFSDKDIIKETEKIAPYVKHVHLSDNFGFEHTELPMGMGNVPLKEMMEKLGQKGFEAKKIIEAASWWEHMKTSPVKESLEGFGSPMYLSGGTPYWNQSLGFQQGYSSGYGMMLPSNNYQLFGAGFSQLPIELGGDVKGASGRFSERGME